MRKSESSLFPCFLVLFLLFFSKCIKFAWSCPSSLPSNNYYMHSRNKHKLHYIGQLSRMSSSFGEGLKPEEFQILEQEEIISTSIDGKTKVSMRLLSISSSQGFSLIYFSLNKPVLNIKIWDPESNNENGISLISKFSTSIQILYKDLIYIEIFEFLKNLKYLILIEYFEYTKKTKVAKIFTKCITRLNPKSNLYSFKK